ncbi:hypothetical protein ACFPJ2_12365, partial [Microbacterium suwonense]|uniref:hypothetical protein n=1 Tax=Microbacterium suwonense TaxID=683047 RepID=UPI00361086E5
MSNLVHLAASDIRNGQAGSRRVKTALAEAGINLRCSYICQAAIWRGGRDSRMGRIAAQISRARSRFRHRMISDFV